MKMPSAGQRKALEKACQNYQENVIVADSYLRDRGIRHAWANKWRLGVVNSPEPGHEHAIGRLAIPYRNRLGVTGFKFRCIGDHDCKSEGHTKYTSPHGQSVFIFNVVATDDPGPVLHVTEGELDCIVLSEVLGAPVIGIPGAKNWQSHWSFHFSGFSRVLVWAHGDGPGRELGSKFRREIQMAEVLYLPAGMDVNAVYLTSGPEALRELGSVGEESPELEVAHV